MVWRYGLPTTLNQVYLTNALKNKSFCRQGAMRVLLKVSDQHILSHQVRLTYSETYEVTSIDVDQLLLGHVPKGG